MNKCIESPTQYTGLWVQDVSTFSTPLFTLLLPIPWWKHKPGTCTVPCNGTITASIPTQLGHFSDLMLLLNNQEPVQYLAMAASPH
jgi:hypothetical protein